jgi:hypothetical protein
MPRHSRMAETPAYVIVTHSRECGDVFEVPPETTVIIKAKPSQVTDARDDIDTLLCSRDSNILSNPEEHKSDIVDRLGSVAIYPAGAKIPNMNLTLFVGRERVGQRRTAQFIPLSGVIPISSKAACKNIRTEMVEVELNAPPDIVVPLMYEHSVFPLKEDIEKFIETENDKRDVENPLTVKMLMEKKPDSFKEITSLKLKDLLAKVGPGVFYFISCRGTVNVDPYNINATATRRGKKYRYTLRNNIANRQLFRGNSFTGTNVEKAYLLRTIAEAEFRRKGAIRGSRFNRPSPRRATRRNSRRGA